MLIIKLLFLIWFVTIFYETNYLLYFWQLKEYRVDRFLIDFKENKGRILLTKWVKIKLGVLILFLILLVFNSNFISELLKQYGIYAIFVLYIFNLLYLIFKTKFKYPKFTKKTSLIFFLTIFIVGLSGISNILSFNIHNLILIDIILLPILSFWVLLFIPFTKFFKEKIVSRAIKKRDEIKNLISIGITGSFGKSSTKEFVAQILSYKYSVVKTDKHQNTEIGSSRAILQMNSNTEIFVAEMGAYKELDIMEISKVVKPNYGIITGINEQHLALQGSIENIINTKFELAEELSDGSTLLINKQALKYSAVRNKIKEHKKRLKIIEYGEDDVYNIKENLYKLEFTYKKNIWKTRVIGAHLIPNILSAIIIAEQIGMNIIDIQKAVENLIPPKIAFFVKTFAESPFKKLKNNKPDNKKTFIIDDTYSANSTGVLSALDFIERVGKEKKKILIMRSLVELGDMGKEIHSQINRKIEIICDIAFIIDNNFKNELQSKKIIWTDNSKQIIEKIKEIRNEKDLIILLENRLPKEILNSLKF